MSCAPEGVASLTLKFVSCVMQRVSILCQLKQSSVRIRYTHDIGLKLCVLPRRVA